MQNSIGKVVLWFQKLAYNSSLPYSYEAMAITIISQPDDSRFGNHLNDLLSNTEFKNFVAAVAFVTSSGASALRKQVEALLKRGGSARFIVGVDGMVTTVEGLMILLQLVAQGAKVSVFHDEDPSVIYHPKGYLVEGPDRAVLLVGSNNLTGKGLYDNCEMSLLCDLDLKNAGDAATVKAFKDAIKLYESNPSVCRPLTGKLIAQLNVGGYLGSEAKGSKNTESSAEGESVTKPSSPTVKLFGTKGVKKVAPKSPAVFTTTGTAASATAVPTTSTSSKLQAAAPSITLSSVGPLVWRKVLSASDAQNTSGNTNAVGGIRLTQAKFKVNAKVIDQTSYFRKVVFGGQAWKQKKKTPFEENTFIDTEVIIKGKSHGIRSLEVSHKPSGEAGQGNYTTQIHWGDMNPTIKASHLTGMTLDLYAPAPGSTQYRIEIS